MLDEFLIGFMIYNASNFSISWSEEVKGSYMFWRESPASSIKCYCPFDSLRSGLLSSNRNRVFANIIILDGF